MDGIDLALVRSDGSNFVERGPDGFVAYKDETRQRIEEGLSVAKSIANRRMRPGALALLERELTELHHLAIREFLSANDLSMSEIDLIGFHGHTVLHKPDDALTVQLGDGQYLAAQTGIEVMYDFRANDMEYGGQGAPLVPVYHSALHHNISSQYSRKNPIVFANIGGISNITYIGTEGQLIAFDSGPGNCLIDQWVKEKAGLDFDENGAIAQEGRVIEEICTRYLAHPYFQRSLPKSLDRKDFSPLLDTNVTTADGARSLTRLTALALMFSIDQLPDKPALIIVCGGGALNPVIMQDLRALAQQDNIQVITADEASFSSAAMEAEAFAYLAIRSKTGEPLTYPMTTNCRLPVTGGVSALPTIARENLKSA